MTSEKRRVVFFGHALLPGELSTSLINRRLTEVGAKWGQSEGISWLRFRFVPPSDLGGKEVEVEIVVIPLFAKPFFTSCVKGEAYGWVEKAALQAIKRAEEDRVSHLVLGWGALTKEAMKHGVTFREQHPVLPEWVSSTHGDAGTAALVLQAMKEAEVGPGDNIVVIGANGAIGDAVSRSLPTLGPAKIILVGKPDKEGEFKNKERLKDLQERLIIVPGSGTQVSISQDKTRACHDHASTVVVVATTAMGLSPKEIPERVVVYDITTPSACQPVSSECNGWDNRLVLVSGCGQFDPGTIPDGLGSIGGEVLFDVGAGGKNVVWGCLGETIARAAFGWRGHLTGQDIPLQELTWSMTCFAAMGFIPQTPVSFGQPYSWEEIRAWRAQQCKRE